MGNYSAGYLQTSTLGLKECLCVSIFLSASLPGKLLCPIDSMQNHL